LSKSSRKWWMGFAILWIVSFHFWHLEGGLKSYINIDFFDFFFEKGYLGVDIFFFLSVYGCACSYSRNTLKRFYKNRFFRIFPIFPIYTLVLALLVSDYYHQPWWLLFIKQVSGLSTFTFSGLWIEWYMPALVLVYGFFPLIYKLARVLHTRMICFFVVVLLSSLFVFVTDKIFISNFALRLPIIIIGCVTYFILLQDHNHQRLLAYYLIAAIIAFIMIRNVGLLCSLILPLLLLVYSKSSLSLPFNGFFCFIGEHSLEVYLAQNLAFDHFMGKGGIDNPVIKFPLCIAIIIVVSCLLYFLQHYSSQLFRKM